MSKDKTALNHYNYIAQRKAHGFFTALCGTLMVLGLLCALGGYALRSGDGLSGALGTVFIVGLAIFFACGIILVALIVKQERINSMFLSMIVLWEYNSRYLYRFRRQEARRKKPIISLVLLALSIVSSAIGISYTVSPAPQDADVFYCIAVPLFVLAVVCFAPVLCRLRYYFYRLFGAEKHIVLARRGVYAGNRLLNFGFNSTTFFKAEQRKVGSFDCISFYYHRRMGFSLITQVYDVPIPPDTSGQEIAELLEIYNSADLFYGDTPAV